MDDQHTIEIIAALPADAMWYRLGTHVCFMRPDTAWVMLAVPRKENSDKNFCVNQSDLERFKASKQRHVMLARLEAEGEKVVLKPAGTIPIDRVERCKLVRPEPGGREFSPYYRVPAKLAGLKEPKRQGSLEF